MAGGNQIRLRVAGNRLKAARQSFCGSPGGTAPPVDLHLLNVTLVHTLFLTVLFPASFISTKYTNNDLVL